MKEIFDTPINHIEYSELILAIRKIYMKIEQLEKHEEEYYKKIHAKKFRRILNQIKYEFKDRMEKKYSYVSKGMNIVTDCDGYAYNVFV